MLADVVVQQEEGEVARVRDCTHVSDHSHVVNHKSLQCLENKLTGLKAQSESSKVELLPRCSWGTWPWFAACQLTYCREAPFQGSRRQA